MEDAFAASSWFEKAVEMVKFKLTLAYDGAAYHGWQSRPDGSGVQNRVEKALAGLFVSSPRLESASRTDSGVHARGMVAHFELQAGESLMRPGQLVLAINSGLPEDIRAVAVARVPSGFHARFDSTGKEYRYQIWNHAVMNPLMRHQAWHVARRLDIPAMEEAARLLIGRHDFRAFTSNRDVVLEDAVRTLTRCEIGRRGALLTIRIEGGGFLYKMCRCIAGTLVQVGLGKFTPADVAAILEGKDRRASGMNAPAHGLILWKVFYPRK